MRTKHAAVAFAFAAVVLAGCAEDLGAPGVGAGTGALRGVVRDAMTGEALAGVRVALRDASDAPNDVQVVTSTDEDGRFELVANEGVRAIVIAVEGYLEGSVERIVVRAGEWSDADVTLYPKSPDDFAMRARLEALSVERSALRDDPFDPALRPEARAILEGDPIAPLAPSVDAPAAEIGAARAALDAPPATIRIWRRSIDGAAESCSGRIDVIPFEDYVKGVLPHEWIPSWHAESLRAGALAIRTYSWRWILAGGKYDCADLDDTTRSQVYRDDRVAVASDAVDATSGEGIVRSGSLVSGEYSAENSNPTADGVSDPPCDGQALLGHGRGMCQWGSQRWATRGNDHRWIAEHYWPGATVAGGGPSFAASLAGMDHPAEMTAGDRAVAWVELRNDGGSTWSLDTTRLGTTMPRDRASAFFDAENWINDHRATGPDHSGYGSGAIGRFTFMIHAPDVDTDTTVTETFGLVEEGVEWFGPEDITIEILVHPRAGTDPVTGPDGGGDVTVGGDLNPKGVDPKVAAPARSELQAMDELHGSCSVVAHGPGAAPSAPLLAMLALAIALAFRGRRRG